MHDVGDWSPYEPLLRKVGEERTRFVEVMRQQTEPARYDALVNFFGSADEQALLQKLFIECRPEMDGEYDLVLKALAAREGTDARGQRTYFFPTDNDVQYAISRFGPWRSGAARVGGQEITPQQGRTFALVDGGPYVLDGRGWRGMRSDDAEPLVTDALLRQGANEPERFTDATIREFKEALRVQREGLGSVGGQSQPGNGEVDAYDIRYYDFYLESYRTRGGQRGGREEPRVGVDFRDAGDGRYERVTRDVLDQWYPRRFNEAGTKIYRELSGRWVDAGKARPAKGDLRSSHGEDLNFIPVDRAFLAQYGKMADAVKRKAIQRLQRAVDKDIVVVRGTWPGRAEQRGTVLVDALSANVKKISDPLGVHKAMAEAIAKVREEDTVKFERDLAAESVVTMVMKLATTLSSNTSGGSLSVREAIDWQLHWVLRQDEVVAMNRETIESLGQGSSIYWEMIGDVVLLDSESKKTTKDALKVVGRIFEITHQVELEKVVGRMKRTTQFGRTALKVEDARKPVVKALKEAGWRKPIIT